MCTAGATWSRWTAQRITAGKGIQFQSSVAALLGTALLIGGCASPSIDPMHQYVDAAQRNMDIVLRQARTEASGLRAELADARIAAAKQEAELQELRQQVSELRQTVEARQAEQGQVRAERDKLNQVKSELQTQLVEVPLLRQSLADAKAGEAKAQAQVKELQSALATTSGELKKFAKGGVVSAAKAGAQFRKRSKPVTTAAATDARGSNTQEDGQVVAQSSVTPAAIAQAGLLTAGASATDPSGNRQVTVLKDETLWRIARRFGLTVNQLQEANGLHGTLILEGQTLIIPGR